MKIILPLMLIFLTGCAAATPLAGKSLAATTKLPATPTQPALRDLGPAPELTNTIWINTDTPLRLANLRGKVVLLEMWTFDCINCRHTIPTLNSWYNTYSSQGLVIIGNHFPEFPVEADLNNLKQAVQELEIQYPVAQDNQGVTWNAYQNRFWPTMYLIDKASHIRYIQIGEGGYAITEAAIQELLTAKN
ncbi:MAG TPA: redoxin domain-containing protein [Anaerolineales bacterium]|nr:redoxin domain-containing protein [Anaerolineales bacterium]